MGIKQGQIEGELKSKKKFEAALKAIQSALIEHQKHEREFYSNIENTIIDLSIAIAEKVVQHEIQMNRNIIRTVVQKTLSMVQDSKQVTVIVHPDDEAVIRDYWDGIKTSFKSIEKWGLRTNPSVEPGGCLVETPNETIDARVNHQIELIKSFLQEGLEDANN